MAAKKKTKKKPAPETPFVVTSLGVYEVEGGRVVDKESGTSRIDLAGETIGNGPTRRLVALYIPREELGFYPIGAKVRVKVARVT